ncbi:MAG: hypothetical protein FOGNACKC_05615 [Anaerolineae bacterium]|nr:hypothetical protein [Anaerolineae bacterium]
MSTLTSKLAQRDSYLDTLGVQLNTLGTEIEHLRAEMRHIKPASRYEFFHQLQAATDKLKETQDQYRSLSLSGPDHWDELKAQIDESFAALNLEMHQTRLLARKLEHGSQSWAKGMSEEEAIDSGGWVEGFTEADLEISKGWAEGQAEEQDIESRGWKEGFAKK